MAPRAVHCYLSRGPAGRGVRCHFYECKSISSQTRELIPMKLWGFIESILSYFIGLCTTSGSNIPNFRFRDRLSRIARGRNRQVEIAPCTLYIPKVSSELVHGTRRRSICTRKNGLSPLPDLQKPSHQINGHQKYFRFNLKIDSINPQSFIGISSRV